MNLRSLRGILSSLSSGGAGKGMNNDAQESQPAGISPLLPVELLEIVYRFAATPADRRALRSACRFLRIAAASPGMPRDCVAMPLKEKTAEEVLLHPSPRGWPALRWGRVVVDRSMANNPSVIALLARASAGCEDCPLRGFHLDVRIRLLKEGASSLAGILWSMKVDSCHALGWSRPSELPRLDVDASEVTCRAPYMVNTFAARGCMDRAKVVRCVSGLGSPYADLIPPRGGPPLSLRVRAFKNLPGGKIAREYSKNLVRRDFVALAAQRSIVSLDLDAANSLQLAQIDLRQACPDLVRLSCSTALLCLDLDPRGDGPAFPHLSEIRIVFDGPVANALFFRSASFVAGVRSLECFFSERQTGLPSFVPAMPELRRLSVRREMATPLATKARDAIGWFISLVEEIEGLLDATLVLKVARTDRLTGEQRKAMREEMAEVACACEGAVLSEDGMRATVRLLRDGKASFPSRENFPRQMVLCERGSQHSGLGLRPVGTTSPHL
jgi:hypothetical protein